MTLNAIEPVTPGATVPAGPGEVPPPPAPAGGLQPHARRWSRHEYYEMARLGWFKGKRVLLLDGEIYEAFRQGNWHSVALALTERRLREVFPEGRFWVRSQCPLDLPGGTSEPEPDAALVPGTPDDYTAHPTTALLVVEVADSSVGLDRKKAHAYAKAGIQDYWIVDIGGHQVEVYRQPVADEREPMGHRYASVTALRPGASINPVAAPQAAVAVADLLPKQPVANPDA